MKSDNIKGYFEYLDMLKTDDTILNEIFELGELIIIKKIDNRDKVINNLLTNNYEK